jgi:hypothetical protein
MVVQWVTSNPKGDNDFEVNIDRVRNSPRSMRVNANKTALSAMAHGAYISPQQIFLHKFPQNW